MKAKEIQDLIDFIAQSGLDEVNIETEGLKLNVKRNAGIVPVVQAVLPAAAAAALSPATAPAAAAQTPAATVQNDSTVIVRSPMIGTFYRSASPESPLFVEVGDDMKKGQVVCIIEAMKLFNEIESEVSGRIVKVLVENATPVEYDQPLFIVEPN